MKQMDEMTLRADARKHAEDRLREFGERPATRLPLPELDAARLIHELQVHQVELEMQNQELGRSRAQAEVALRRYMELYDLAPVGYFTISRNGAIGQVNLTGARMLGVARSRLLGARLGIFVDEADRPAFNGALACAMTTELAGECEVALAPSPHTGLERHYLQMTLSSRGTEEECRVVVVDISARKKAEEQLHDAQKMGAVAQLAGGIAHDFNNMLTVVLHQTEFALRNPTADAPLRQNLVEIRQAAQRVSALTRQLLAFSRTAVIRAEVVDVGEFARGIGSAIRRTVGEDIEFVLAPSVELGRVEIDPRHLDEILMNLVRNARDAMPTGGTLTVTTANVDLGHADTIRGLAVQPGPFVRLTVTDTGAGMDATMAAHVFEPFFTTKELGHGTGLGLSSVYGIVKQCGGDVAVRSELGRGTTFDVFLPRTAAAPTPAPTTLTKGEVPATATGTILVVDDEPIIRQLVERTLTAAGYTVLAAANGAEALSLSLKHADTIHLALSDVSMPGMTGIAFAERLQAVHPETRILFMSGFASLSFGPDHSLDAATQLIEKPFTASELTRKVREILTAV